MARPRRVYTTPSSWSGDRRSFPDKIRRAILTRDPVCSTPGCAAPSTIADHIVNHTQAKRLGWTVEQYHHIDNGQGMCRRHHDAKTRQEQAAGRRTRRREPEPHPGMLP